MKPFVRFRFAVALGFCLVMFQVALLAQTITGSIYGTVSDNTNAAVPSAVVVVTNMDNHATRTVQSNASGDYAVSSLDPGNYQVTVNAPGFKSVAKIGIVLSANQNAQAGFALQPGSVNETVTVTAGLALVDTRESTIGQTIDQQQIETLPSVNRSAYSLTQTLPGVTNYTEQAVVGGATGNEFSLNGQRANFNSYYLDGAFNTAIYRGGGNQLPNPDALQEFRVLTSNADVEFGRYPGAVVSVITRSGTNAYHGLAYDYLRNNIFNAKNYFATSVNPLKQNQFGGNIGGPILRNKLFAFLAYEGLRIHTPYTVNSVSLFTATTAERSGDFTNAKNKPKQANGTFYSCNGVMYVICPNQLDPVAQAMLALVPVGIAAGANDSGGNPAQQQAPSNTSLNQGLARLDFQATPSHKLALTFFNSQGSTGALNSGGNQILDYGGQTQFGHQINGILGDTWIISPVALNNLRFFVTRNFTLVGNVYNTNFWSTFGSSIANGAVLNEQPMIAITGYWTMGSGGSGTDQIDQSAFGVSDTFNFTHKRQDMKWGGSFFWNRYAETGAFLGEGKLSFTGSATGNALADFLVGSINTLTQNNGRYLRYHSPAPALFFQDGWKVSHKLTLNLGLRWEVFAPLSGSMDLGTFTPGVQSKRFPTAPVGLLSSGDPGVPDGIFLTSFTKFAPRAGFALDVFGNGKTSLRGSYGLFYAASQENFTNYLKQQPFALSVVTNSTPRYASGNFGLINPYAPGQQPFPYVVNPVSPAFSTSASIAGIRPGSSSVPYVQEYNLTAEQQLTANSGVQFSYIGSVSREFIIARDQNAPVFVPGAATTTAGLNARRPYQPYGQISLLDPSSNASYNSLVVSLTDRVAHRLTLNGSFVWSKNIDITSSDPSNVTNFALANQNNLLADRASSTLEVPLRFVASYIWQLPEFRRWGFIGRQVLSGWQINGITTFAAGSPFNILSGKDTNLDGIATDRPNLVGNPQLPGNRSRAQKIGEYFNIAAFSQITTPTVPYGTSPRNPLSSPGYRDTDLSAFKSFPIWRESKLQFRGEVFNVFNNVNLSTPVATLSSGSFGSVTAAGNARIVQFALRYSF